MRSQRGSAGIDGGEPSIDPLVAREVEVAGADVEVGVGDDVDGTEVTGVGVADVVSGGVCGAVDVAGIDMSPGFGVVVGAHVAVEPSSLPGTEDD